MTAAASAGPSRGPWIASVVLALAIVAAAGLAVLTLMGVRVAPLSSLASVISPAAAEPAPAAAPAAPAEPAPAQPVPAQPAPAVAAPPSTPAGAPAVTDATGRALPAAVGTGVQGLYTALGAGDLPGVQSRYRPAEEFDAAPWSQVAPLLAVPANREALQAALREPPTRRTGIYRYAAGGAVVGIDTQGRMAFLLVP
jgi:hypothetical protein